MDADEELSVVEALARLTFVTMARLEAFAAEAELSMQQVRLLGILRDREPTINQLAAHLGTDKSSMSGAVARAERRGLVSRIPDEADGRSVRVRLEPAGRTLFETASARFETDTARMFSTLTATGRARWATLTTQLLAAEAAERHASFAQPAPNST